MCTVFLLNAACACVFATVRYEQISKNFKNQFMHLTNYSVNKKSGDYVRCDDPEVEDYGNKWSMSAMLRYLKEDGIDTAALMSQVEDLIIKTIISGEHAIAAACNSLIAHRGNCFELYGFDVLIDKNLKPWLLEVNLSPSLACDSPLDLKVKASVISDMLSLVGVECHDPQRFRRGGSAPVERNKRTQKNTRQRLLSASDVNTALQAGNRIIVKRTSCTLGLSIEEMKVLHRIQDEAERRGGFVRIFPRKDTWQLYGSFLEYKTSLNCMLAKHLFLDRPQMTGSCERLYEDLTKPNVAQYERKLVSLHVRRSRQRKLASKTATGSPYDKECKQKDNGEEEEEEMAKDDEPDVVPEPLTPATDCSTDAVFKPSHNLLAALQKDANLSKVQARLAFSSYLQRVQSRLQSVLDPSRLRPNEEEQMELVIRFLRRAAGNLQRTLHVNHPCTTIPVIERRRLLAKQLREFIHLYNEETQHLMSCEEAADSKVQTINHKDFQAFIAEANECDLEEILTVYTQKNKSASVFLGTQNSASLRATKERQGGARDCKTQMDGVALCSDAQQRLVGQAHGPEIPKASCVSQPSSSAVTVIPEHCAPRADSSKPFANGHSIGRYLQPTSCTGLTTESAGSSLSDPRSHSNSLGTFSSFQSAAQIYSQRLSHPSSTRSAGSRHSVLRTRCHSAHAGKEPENPYNEREVTASLQRLAERQSIQQQSGHLKTITQQVFFVCLPCFLVPL
ncbi:tubulin polyglutamylase TTLL5 [Bombina bombina]|uniref:tubulin polyglutamylase TTLL5 n=1 Tax=Bombina bombina TaxID=8345 RepID=UPI00235AA4BC|nr:tubulin polyglutamylase TTLL5 [Bombina bombina]